MVRPRVHSHQLLEIQALRVDVSLTPPKFNMPAAPAKWWLEDGPASFWEAKIFRGELLNFQGMPPKTMVDFHSAGPTGFFPQFFPTKG